MRVQTVVNWFFARIHPDVNLDDDHYLTEVEMATLRVRIGWAEADVASLLVADMQAAGLPFGPWPATQHRPIPGPSSHGGASNQIE